MTFDLPSAELRAPSAPLSDLSGVPATADTLAAYGNAKHLDRLLLLASLQRAWLSGVPERTMQLLSSLRRLESLVVFGYRAPTFSALRPLSTINSLAIVGSSQLRSLAGVEALLHLQSLLLVDCTRIKDLEPLRHLPELQTLILEGGISKELRLPSLWPLAPLVTLRRLRLASIRVDDRSLEPLQGLTQLRDVFFADVFPRNEFRRLAAALPQASGDWLDHYRAGDA